MNGFTEEADISELIKTYFDFMNITYVDPQIIKIILQKTWKGVPMFVIDLMGSLLNQKLVQFVSNQILSTNEIHEMDINGDWVMFNCPIRYEKILGNIIDNFYMTEIIILKYASVIGNLFDLDNLNRILPFNDINQHDLYTILQKFEVNIKSNFLTF